MQSKGLTIRTALLVILGMKFGVSGVVGCGVNYNWDGEVDGWPCLDRTYSDYHSIKCKEDRCRVGKAIPEDNCPDAGATDAGSSEDAGSSARCPGTCLENAPDFFAEPEIVYIGPPTAKYAAGCWDKIGADGAFQYMDLNVPPPGCPSCICGTIEGSCSPTPNIVLHADVCFGSQADETIFSGPDGWDGSCTTANAVPAGLECPLGSGIPCAGSIESTALPPPVQGCKPIPLPVPNATSDNPWWSTIVLSCNPNSTGEACAAPASTSCYPELPSDGGWHYCVRALAKGIAECPKVGVYNKSRFVAYDGYVDTRTCTKCGCDAAGGECFGTLRAYSDDTCSTNELLSTMLSSAMGACSNFQPPGERLGSKEITDLMYVPGTCTPTGGEPIGTVYPDESTAVTWCCM